MHDHFGLLTFFSLLGNFTIVVILSVHLNRLTNFSQSHISLIHMCVGNCVIIYMCVYS